jgi:Protein of unknwon function (DUF3310)
MVINKGETMMKKAIFKGATDFYLTNLGTYDIQSIDGDTVYLKTEAGVVAAVHRNSVSIFNEVENKATPYEPHPDQLSTLKKMIKENEDAFDAWRYSMQAAAENLKAFGQLALKNDDPTPRTEAPVISFDLEGWKANGKGIDMNNTDIMSGSPLWQEPKEKSIAYNPGEKDVEEDLINEPNHYHKGGIDIYGIMGAKFNEEKEKGFCIGNVLKYVIRHEMKGTPLQDLKKARFNLDRLIELTEKELNE